MVEEKKKSSGETVKTLLKVIVGIALLVVGVYLIWLWRFDVLTIIKGFLGMVIVLAGVIFLAIAKE